jgi:hypothetical protein
MLSVLFEYRLSVPNETVMPLSNIFFNGSFFELKKALLLGQ